MDVEKGNALLRCGRGVRLSAFSEFSCGKCLSSYNFFGFCSSPNRTGGSKKWVFEISLSLRRLHPKFEGEKVINLLAQAIKV
jgi:hypothetical protein